MGSRLSRSLAICALLSGCGAAPAPPLDARARAGTTGGESGGAGVEAAAGGAEEDVGPALSELALLEARLSEAEAENAALRAALSSAHRARVSGCAGDASAEIDVAGDAGATAAEDVELASGEDGPRPVLRLYGPPVAERPALRTEGVTALPGPEAPAIAYAAPPGSLGRLAVTADAVPAIPASPILVVPRTGAPAAPRALDAAATEYEAALRLVSERDLDGALAAFAAFLEAHPTHAYADNALYWRAEVHYARHEWPAAIAELESLLLRFPRGSKAPDALLRLGMCWERLGDAARARTYFERVLREHPDSTAAHMASREDT